MVFISVLKSFILKSPINIHVSPSLCTFVNSGVKYSLLKRPIFIPGCLETQPQNMMYLLLGEINSIKADSNLPGSLIRRYGCYLKVKLSERKKTCSSVTAFVFIKIKSISWQSKINIHWIFINFMFRNANNIKKVFQ